MRARLIALLANLGTEHTDPVRLGAAVGLGVFVGVLPLYGLHAILCLALATVLRLNKVTVVLASQVSIPPIAPLLVTAGIAIGEWLRFGILRAPDPAVAHDLIAGLRLLASDLPDWFLSCLLGDAVLGAVLGASAGLATWAWARRRAR